MKFPKEIIIRFEADAKGTTVTAMDGGELIRCRDCKYSVDEYDDGECYCDYEKDLRYIKDWDHYCSWAERKTDPSYRSITCDYCKHWHGLKRGGIYWCSKHSLYMETGCEEGERKEE